MPKMYVTMCLFLEWKRTICILSNNPIATCDLVVVEYKFLVFSHAIFVHLYAVFKIGVSMSNSSNEKTKSILEQKIEP